MLKKEQEWTCMNCGVIFERYESKVKNVDRVFCSRKCLYEYQETELVRQNNPNYREGSCCGVSLCGCGKQKDYRAKRCSKCAGKGFPKKYNFSSD